MPKMNTSLTSWLHHVIDELDIHSRANWGHVLGVTEQTIGNWVRGASMPRAEKLRELVVLLRDRYAPRAALALVAWKSLAILAPHAAWGADVKTDAHSLADYIIVPLWDDLHLAVDALPHPEQEEVLEDAIESAHRRTLGATADILAASNDEAELDEALARLVPHTAKSFLPEVMSFVHEAKKHKSTFAMGA